MLNPIVEFDRALSLWVHSCAQLWLDATMKSLTHAGSWWVLLLVTLLCGGFLLVWHGLKREPVLMLLAFSLSYLINPWLKLFFQRERPQLWATIIPLPGDHSFPSGHAMSAMAVYGLAALLLARAHPQQRWSIWLSAATLIALIGFSRVYLGVHWPTDVLAGFVTGFALVWGVMKSETRLRGSD
jgi:undecaprenyl-diphosphatase